MSNPKGLKKIDVSSQGTENSQNFRCETLYITDYERINRSSFAVSDIKLCLEEEASFNTNHPLQSFQIHSIKGSKLTQNVVIFNHTFISNTTDLKILAYS